jgi:ribosomal-protein-serine acetyltransferase
MIDGMTMNGVARARLPLSVRPGLELELASPAVAAEYYALVERNLERLARWEPWAGAPQSLTGVRLYLAWQAQAYTSGSQVPLLLRLDGELVGSCSARIDATDGTAEIGYWIDGEQEGRGVASAGVAALVGLLLDRGDIGRVQARAAAGNARSRALLERLGFSFEGVLRSSQRIAGGRQDMAMYALLPGD